MDTFSLQILTNDVEYLGKNMKAVFQQLRVLQEFIKLEYGVKFQDFCAQSQTQYHSLLQPNVGETATSLLPEALLVTEKPVAATSTPLKTDVVQSASFNAKTAFVSNDNPPSPINSRSSRIRKCRVSNYKESDACDESVFESSLVSTPIAKRLSHRVTTNSLSKISKNEDPEFSWVESENEEENEFIVKPEFFQIPDGMENSDEEDKNEEYFQNSVDEEMPGVDQNEQQDADGTSHLSLSSLARRSNPEVMKNFKTPTVYAYGGKAECLRCGKLVSNRFGRLVIHLQSNCLNSERAKPTKPKAKSIAKARQQRKAPGLSKEQSSNITAASVPSTRSRTTRAPIRDFFIQCNLNGIPKSQCKHCGKLVSDKPIRMTKHYAQCVIGVTGSGSGINYENDLDESLESFDHQDSLDSQSDSVLCEDEN